jgi:uracil-DNA glycosylase family 4
VTQRAKPNSCIGCPCHDHGTDFSEIEGTGSSGVMAIAEASGEMEARDQLPLRPYAPAGSVFERVLRRMGVDRQQFSVTNVLRCRPRHNWLENAPWEYGAINHCRANLDRAVAERRPRAILALGGVATRELTGLTGKAQGVTHLAGYVLPCLVGQKWPAVAQVKLIELGLAEPQSAPIPVIPNFHPAYIRRGKASHQGVFARIMQRAINVAKGTYRNWMWNVDLELSAKELQYEIRPTLADADAYTRYVLANPSLVLSYDLETDESASLDEDAREGFVDTHIRLVQFAIEGRGAIAIPWEPGFLPSIRALLQSPNTKCGHNVWIFDNKVLRAAGEREGIDVIPRGIIHDTLAMFHHWQPDLPAHLQFAAHFIGFPFPWKHLAGTDLAFYGCCDVDSDLRLFKMLEKTLKRDGLWDDSDAMGARAVA